MKNPDQIQKFMKNLDRIQKCIQIQIILYHQNRNQENAVNRHLISLHHEVNHHDLPKRLNQIKPTHFLNH